MSNEYDEAATSLGSTRWLRIQTDLVSRFKHDVDGLTVSAAASHFMVARQFPKRNAIRAEDFSPVVGPLKLAAKDVDRSNLADRVTKLAQDLKDYPALTRGTPISAASKLLWCAAPDVGVIYDQHARNQLARLGYRIPHRDYRSFAEAFAKESARRSNGLLEALERNKIEGESWLSEKLLDHWLYLEGRK